MRDVKLFNENWLFHKGDIEYSIPGNKSYYYLGAKTERYKIGPASRYYLAEVDPMQIDRELEAAQWHEVKLPHDYLLDSPIDKDVANTLGCIKRENGWYIKKFFVSDEDKNKRITIFFEGVAVKSTIYLNGCLMKHNFSAYNSFEVDITDYVLFNEENRLVVYCDTTESEGWWYQGGGIYRDVYLVKTELVSVDLWGVYVKTTLKENNDWQTKVTTTIRNDEYKNKIVKVKSFILDSEDNIVGENIITKKLSARSVMDLSVNIDVNNPKRWSPDTPNLYKVKSEVYLGNNKVDEYESRFGFRTYYIDPNKGLFINDKLYKINGVCGHNNGGRLFGQAVPKNIFKYKIQKLKEIGINGYRTSHYMQNNYLMDVLDEEGFIVMDETRWFESTDESKDQLKALIKRDRNRPSVFFWSLLNEEPYTCTEQGRRIFKHLKEYVKTFDDTRYIVAAVSYSIDKTTIFEDSDVCGINYEFDTTIRMHEKYPNKGILYSEFIAASTTRGWYYDDDNEKGYRSSYDKAFNHYFVDRNTNYKFLKENEFLLGGYSWNGFEYMGETNYPRLCSCCGIIDLFLQKKDSYYHTASFTSSKPMIYLMPHWNFVGQEGRKIRVVAYTNAERAELFLNGKSLGVLTRDNYQILEWEVPFEPGELLVKGYCANGEIIEDKRITPKKPYQLKLKLETEDVIANNDNVALYTCSVVDEDGNEIPDANPEVSFICNGPAKIYSTGSDTSDHSSPFLSTRKMFNGKISVAVLLKEPGEVTLIANSFGLRSTYLVKDFK